MTKSRIYLVDDEQPVLDGLAVTLRKLVDEVEICGTSRSGREAVEGIAREKPDVAILDVRMPGLSGLDALRELRRLAPDTLTILLTAYERFDIAKEAFALGVHDYLVKPVEQETLAASVRGALAKLAERKEAAIRAAAARDDLERARPLLEAGFAYAALFAPRGAGRLADFAERLGFRLPAGDAPAGFFAAVVRRGASGGSGLTAAGLGAEEAAALREELSYRLPCAVGLPVGGVLPVFVRGAAEECMPSVSAALEAAAPGALAAGLGRARSLRDLRSSWEEAVEALSLAADVEGPFVAVGGPPDPGRDVGADASADEAEAALDAASRGDAAAASARFSRWAASGPGPLRRAALAGALVAAAGGRAESALAAASAQDLAGEEGLAAALSAVADAGRAVPGEGPQDRRLRAVLLYISARYAEPLSLEGAAEIAGLSPAHLSRLLVAETGAAFTEHLARVRIERAKRELAEGARTVKEIAALCGYPDANYFSRAFKRESGLTPSEYSHRFGRSIL